MMSDFRGIGGSKMNRSKYDPKNRTLEDRSRTIGGRGSKLTPKIGHHSCMFPFKGLPFFKEKQFTLTWSSDLASGKTLKSSTSNFCSFLSTLV